MFLGCILTAGLITGCSGKDGTADAEKKTGTPVDVLNVSGGLAVTLNQFASQASNDSDCFYLLMSSLVRYYDGNVEPDAAESWKLSDDQLTYTFQLRDGLKYADGSAITAGDFAYALMKLVEPESGSAFAYNYYEIKGAGAFSRGEGSWADSGVSAPDDKTLIITLEKPDGAFLDLLALYPFYPVTEEYVAKWGDSMGSSPESVLCSGPYTLSEWAVGTSMTFTKNHDWWNSKNAFPMETINIMDIDSANTEVSMFLNGELDVASSIDTNYVSSLGDSVSNYESSTEMLLWIKEKGTSDEATACLDNDNFRKALTYALDREAVGAAVSAGFIGTNRAVSSNYPGITGKYIEDYPVDTAPVQGDPEQAKNFMNKAMQELGYKDAADFPEMSFVTFERPDIKILGEAVADTWKQVLGLTKINFVQYPIGTAIQHFYTGQYDIFMISLGCTLSPTDIIECFAADGDYSFFTVNWEADITGILEAANAEEFRSDAYFSKVAEAEQTLLNEFSLVPLYNQTMYYALGEGVEGFIEPGTSFNYQFNHLTVTK